MTKNLIYDIFKKMIPIDVKARNINQPVGKGRAVYSTVLKVKDLIEDRDFKIDFWRKEKKLDKNQGYQRIPTQSRLKKIVKFIEDEKNPIFPTTILLGSRQKLEFKSRDGESGTLKINRPLWIIDGQHRILGLRKAVHKGYLEWKDKELPVIILDNFNKPEETIQFYILNTTQKRVPTDLAQRLIRKISYEKVSPITFSPSEEWKIKGLQIIDLLNETDEEYNAWYGRIRLPNTERKKYHIVSQNSFLNSLRPLLSQGVLQGKEKPSDICYKIIRNYWFAIKKIIPEPFASPREYVIQKTPGVYSLHDLANRIMLGTNDFTRTYFRAILEKVFTDDFDEIFWRSRGEGAAIFNSMKGFRILANQMAAKLPAEEIQKGIKV